MRAILIAAAIFALSGCASPPGTTGPAAPHDQPASIAQTATGSLVDALAWARAAADEIQKTLGKAHAETITGEQAVDALTAISTKAKEVDASLGTPPAEWVPVHNEAKRVLSGIQGVASDHAGKCRQYGTGQRGCGMGGKMDWGYTGQAFDRAAFIANQILDLRQFTRPLGATRSPCDSPIEGVGYTSGDTTACAYTDVVNNSANTTAFFICRLVRYGNYPPECKDMMASGRLGPGQSWLNSYQQTSPLACSLGKQATYRLGFDPANPREIVVERIAHHFDFTFKCSYAGSFNLTTVSIGPDLSVSTAAEPRGCTTFGSYWECRRP